MSEQFPPDKQPEQWKERVHGFLDPKDDKPDHFAAIGRLVTAMNGIDAVLNWILRAQLGADTKRGRAIIGGMRTGDMLGAIRRLAQVNGMSEAELAVLDELRRQINAFKVVRDNIAHRTWAVRGEDMSFHNIHTSRFEDSAEFDTYTVTELNDLARYAPYLSERALDLFPGTVSRGNRLASRETPPRLKTKDQSQGAAPPSAQ